MFSLKGALHHYEGCFLHLIIHLTMNKISNIQTYRMHDYYEENSLHRWFSMRPLPR